jgi:hypothetical protein
MKLPVQFAPHSSGNPQNIAIHYASNPRQRLHCLRRSLGKNLPALKNGCPLKPTGKTSVRSLIFKNFV